MQTTNYTVPVRVGFCLWAIELARVIRKIRHFGVGIVWGAIPSGLPVFQISVSGCSWNSHGTSPNLWGQRKLVQFRQGPKIRDSVLLNSSRVSRLLSPRSPRRPGRCKLGLTQSQVHSVLYWFYCLQAFLLKLPLIFICFLMLPYLLRGKFCQWWKLNFFVLVLINILLQIWRKEFQRFKQSNVIFKKWYNTKNCNLYIIICTFISPIYTFPWRET